SPLFNAGKGAVFTHEGKNELDASIMDGKTLNAGAVAGVSNIQNPVKLARMVKDSSAHVLFSGPGAQKFAIEIGLDTVPDDYFYTDKAWQSLQKKLEKEGKNGTVGCVARDLNGNLAAATSTGGMTNKKHGRIGDSPIIGAGTYADNRYAGVSCTGHGEFFICNAIAYDIIAQMKYTNANIETALQNCIKTLSDQNANGGIIAIDSEGNINSNCNTSGMFRAYVDKNGTKTIRLYK
ncbi:MAG: beta-aspartyl-peptidase, partial [Marinilabiliales bacterium]